MTIQTMLSLLGEGFLTTLAIFFLTLIGSLPLGLVVYFGKKSRLAPVRWLVNAYISVMRGTPLMLQLMVVYFGPNLLFGISLPSNWRFIAVILGFVINYAAYFAEIYRGGIESVPKGQYEAAQVLGMTARETFSAVILMQVVKRILAPISNEVITLVKDTSLARVIAVAEIFFVNEMSYLTKGLVWPLFYIGAFFLVFVGGLTLLFRYLENKLSYYKI